MTASSPTNPADPADARFATQGAEPASANQHGGRSLAHLVKQPRMLTPLVLIMGFIGASLRYLLEWALPANGGFPCATLTVNIVGCFALEIVNRYVGRRLHLPAPVVKSLGLGLVGAFTTLSALSTECMAFLHTGAYGMFALYLAVTMASTFIAALAGHVAADALALRRVRRRRRRAARRRRSGGAQ